MKIRNLFFILITCYAALSFAQTHNISARQVYIGQELHQGRATGNKCFITLVDVRPYNEKGLYCYTADFRFNSIREDVPKMDLSVDSRVTNYHRSEFPELRTCAMNVDGTTSGPEIYEENTNVLYNQIFAGSHSSRSVRYDYFLTLDPEEKRVVRARIHFMKTFSEYDVDCVNLELM